VRNELGQILIHYNPLLLPDIGHQLTDLKNEQSLSKMGLLSIDSGLPSKGSKKARLKKSGTMAFPNLFQKS
jgi:hypothetical protein